MLHSLQVSIHSESSHETVVSSFHQIVGAGARAPTAARHRQQPQPGAGNGLMPRALRVDAVPALVQEPGVPARPRCRVVRCQQVVEALRRRGGQHQKLLVVVLCSITASAWWSLQLPSREGGTLRSDGRSRPRSTDPFQFPRPSGSGRSSADDTLLHPKTQQQPATIRA